MHEREENRCLKTHDSFHKKIGVDSAERNSTAVKDSLDAKRGLQEAHVSNLCKAAYYIANEDIAIYKYPSITRHFSSSLQPIPEATEIAMKTGYPQYTDCKACGKCWKL